MKTIKRFLFIFSYIFFLSGYSNAQNTSSKTIIDNIYDNTQIIPSPPKPKDRPSVALILSGGGARGFAHLPVLELLQEYDIPIDIVIGTSIGSIVGGMYCSGYSVDEIENVFFSINWSDVFQDKTHESYEERLGKHSRTAMPFSLNFSKSNDKKLLNLGSGILSGQYAYEILKKLTLKIPSDTNFDDLSTPFRAVGVNLLNGNIEVFTKGDISEAIRASMSIPAFFQPFQIDENYYIDGGTRDNTPIDVARKMGYDIIIVSEISSLLENDYNNLSSNPATVVMQMINMEQSLRNKSLYQDASLVMFPDYGSCTILDFAKSHTIYNKSLESIDQYRPAIQKISDTIKASSNSDNSKPTNASLNDYSKREFSIISDLVVTGGDNDDKKIVTKSFLKIKDKLLTPELYEEFEKSIYKVGKYNTVQTRITKNPKGTSTIEVILNKKLKDDTVVLLGAEYKGTLSADSINDLTFSTEIQKRGFLGHGSILSLHGEVLTDYAIELKYIQPIFSLAYVELDLSSRNKRSFVSSGFDYYPMTTEQTISHEAEFSLGFPLTNWFTLLGGVCAGLYNTEEMVEDGKETSAVAIFSEITFDTLNTACLPTSGFYISTTANGVFPTKNLEKSIIYDVEELTLKGIIPFGSKFGFILNTFTGTNWSEDMKTMPELISVYGFPIADRNFFPQISSSESYGLYKLACSGTLQFCPWDQLTILGGKAFFAISGAVGNTWMDLQDITYKDPIWRSSLDIAVRFSDTFGILVRGGVGKTRGEIYPFVSMDIGKVNF